MLCVTGVSGVVVDALDEGVCSFCIEMFEVVADPGRDEVCVDPGKVLVDVLGGDARSESDRMVTGSGADCCGLVWVCRLTGPRPRGCDHVHVIAGDAGCMFQVFDRSLILERDAAEVEPTPAVVPGAPADELSAGLDIVPFIDTCIVGPDAVDILADAGERLAGAEPKTVDANPPLRISGTSRGVHGEQFVATALVVDEEDAISARCADDLGVGEYLGLVGSMDDGENGAQPREAGIESPTRCGRLAGLGPVGPESF